MSDWERERNRRIAAIQGNGNPYIDTTASARAWVANSGPANPSRGEETAAFNWSPKKTGAEMTSCEEARYHLKQCNHVRLDSDNDGTPCEAMCY